MITNPSKPLLPDTSPSDAPTSIVRDYELDHGPVSDQTLSAKIADLLAVPGSEDVELEIDRRQELPRAADFS